MYIDTLWTTKFITINNSAVVIISVKSPLLIATFPGVLPMNMFVITKHQITVITSRTSETAVNLLFIFTILSLLSIQILNAKSLS